MRGVGEDSSARGRTDLVSTGLADLDVLLGDGVPRGYAVLVVVPAGELPLRLTESFLLGGLTAGEGLLLTLSSLSAEEFAARTARYNIDLASLGEQARIVDWYSWRRERFTGLRDQGQTTKVSKDLVNIEVAVTRAKRKLLKAAPDRRAIFDILGPALADYERMEALDIARSLIAKMRADRITSFWLLSGERLQEKDLAILAELFDGLVRIDGKGNEFTVRVVNLRARPFSREPHALTMGMDGRIVVAMVPLSRREDQTRGPGDEDAPGVGADSDVSFSVRVTGATKSAPGEKPETRERGGRGGGPERRSATPGEGSGSGHAHQVEISEEEPGEPGLRESATPPPAPPVPPPSPAPLRPPLSIQPMGPTSAGRAGTQRGAGAVGRAPRRAARPGPGARTGLTAGAGVVLLVLALLVRLYPLDSREMRVDGEFGDWEGKVVMRDQGGALRPGGIELTEYSLHGEADRLCAYARTSPTLDSGNGGRLVILLDADGNPSTGYRSRGIGADRALTLVPDRAGLIATSSAFSGDEPTNWSAWGPGERVAGAPGPEGRVETCFSAEALASDARGSFEVLGPLGPDDSSECLVAPDRPCLTASLMRRSVSFSAGAAAFELRLRASGRDVEVTGIAPPAPALPPSPPGRIARDATATVQVEVDTAGLAARDAVRLAIGESMVTATATVTLRGSEAVSYFAEVPPLVAVDGIISDWPAAIKRNLSAGSGPLTADLKAIATSPADPGLQAFLVEFHGPAPLTGSPAPGRHVAPSAGGGGAAVPLPKVSGEDVVRVSLDSDNSSSTGGGVHGIGAEWRIEVRGAGGRMTGSSLERFDPATGRYVVQPGESPVAAVSPDGLELGALKTRLGISGAFAYVVEATDWSGVWDRARGDALDPVVIRPDGSGLVGDLGAWSAIPLPALPQGRNWVDVASARDGIQAILRDDGEVYFTDGSGGTADWVRQAGTRPAGWTGVSWMGIAIRQNQALPTNFYIARNDGAILTATTGTIGSALAAWSAFTTTGLPPGTAYVDLTASRNGANFPILLRSDGATFWSNNGAPWIGGSTSGLASATDYVALSAARLADCGGGGQDGMVIARRSGEVYCSRAPQTAAATWLQYGTGGGPPAAGSYVSLAYDDGDDYVYLLRNDGVVYRTGGSGVGSAWTVAGGTGTPVPASTAYVAVSSEGRGASNQFTAYVLRADGQVYRNTDTSTNTAWAQFGTGTPVPAGGGAWVSVGARAGAGLFLLAANGTVQRSVDMGGSWTPFGDAGPDFSWVSVDVSNTDVYALGNDGRVARAPFGSGVFAAWNIGKTVSATSASWVSLAASFDGGLAYAVRALRNDGLVEVAPEATGVWVGDGDADGSPGARFDFAGLASDGANVYALARTGERGKSPTAAPSWSMKGLGSWATPGNASFVDVASTDGIPGMVWLLRNDGEVLRSPDSAESFPDRGFLAGGQESTNAAYSSLAAVPEAGAERSAALFAATAVAAMLLVARSRRRPGGRT